MNSLSFKTRIILVTNLILSNLDYGNALLACQTETSIKPLQLTLNRAIRFIFNLPIRTHITPYLKQLHILPIKFRIKFKICLFSFKVFYAMAPQYLMNKFQKYIPTSTMSLRIGSGRDNFMFDIHIPDHRKQTIIQQMKLDWNSLPLDIRMTNNIARFKVQLKTHFFRIAFS